MVRLLMGLPAVFLNAIHRSPTVTRVRRTVTYTRPVKQRVVERQIYW